MEEKQNKFYMAVKMVKARVCPAPEGVKGDNKPGDPGYEITYPSGYVSWCPKAEFERWNLEVPGDGTKVTGEMVEAMIGNRVEKQYDEKTSLVQVDTPTGFRIIETSSCVDPANFDQAIGADICLTRIKDKLWSQLGFVLQWGKNGLK